MKKINLKGMLNPLSEREMKNVVGGLDFPMIMPEDGGGSGGGTLTPKQEACKPPKVIGGYCEFKDDNGVLRGGRCVQILWSPPHCSNLN